MTATQTEKNPWSDWLTNLPEDGIKQLLDALSDFGYSTKKSNGAAAPAQLVVDPLSTEIITTRQSTDELLKEIEEHPPFVDVFGLVELFNKLLPTGANVILKGEKGTGKSLAALVWAAQTKTPIVRQNCSDETKETHQLGSFYLMGKQTPFALGSFPTAIECANEHGRCLLLPEEVNGLPAQIQKEWNSMLDFHRSCTINKLKGKTFRLRKGAQLFVIATMNPSAYGGTYDLNEDFKSRCQIVDVGYPPVSFEKQIIRANLAGQPVDDSIMDKVVNFAHETRQQATGYALSPRDTVALMVLINALGIEDALQVCLGKFEGDDKKVAFGRIRSHFGDGVASKLRKSWRGGEGF